MKKTLFTTLVILSLALTACGRSNKNNTTQDNNATQNNVSTQDNNTTQNNNNTNNNTTNNAETITTSGTYVLSGKITDKAVTVAAADTDNIEIILDNVTVENKNGPALYIKSAGEVTVTAKEGTTNYFSDGSAYSVIDGQSNVDASIYSNCNLTINGKGTLHVAGNYEHGIVCNDNLTLAIGILNVDAKDTAIDADHDLAIADGYITIRNSQEGLEGNNIVISGGRTLIDVSEDSISVDKALEISGGVIVALGDLDVDQNISYTNTQGVLFANFTKQNGGSSFLISDTNGKSIVSFTPEHSYETAFVSAPGLQTGHTYSIIVGATVADTDGNGFAQNSTYTGGTKVEYKNLTSQNNNK